MKIDKEIKEKIKEAISCGFGSDWHINSEDDEYEVEEFDIDFATDTVVSMLEGLKI